MRIKTFRSRIALLSVLCSSLVLVISALVALDITWNAEIQRVDGFISAVVQGFLNRESLPGPKGPFHHGPGPDGDRRGPGPDDIGPGPDDGGPMFDIGGRGGSGGRGPKWLPPDWNEPPWRRGRGARFNDDMASAPLSLYLFRDLEEMREDKSDDWPVSLREKDLKISADATIKVRTIKADGRLWRIAAGGTLTRIAVFGVDLEPAVANIKQVASAFLLTIPAALALIALGAVFMARRALRPVEDLTRLVERITASGLGERVTSPVKDAEFEKLILVFNQMMDRLERSFMQANRFSADAAHELRTPISILQGYIEQMLRVAEPGSDMQRNLGEMIDEIHRIKSILEKLLLLARMDAGQVELKMSPVDLSAMVQGVVEDIQALAASITVESRIEPGIQVNADGALLETAIQNLGTNAIKYNRKHDGRIVVELATRGDAAVLSVTNTGPKIPGEDVEKIFDRFYRADKSRSRDVDGLGLGLSLAREIVQAHHGRLELADADGDVNRFVITLPRCDEKDPRDQRDKKNS